MPFSLFVNLWSVGGNTVNLYALDLSKAFGKVNHHALLVKLMKRNSPVDLTDILENWLKGCLSSVKWLDVFSDNFLIKFGVRQGSVLSPLFFVIYLNDLPDINSIVRTPCPEKRCHFIFACNSAKY